jgi:hypothetical protein
MQIKISTVINDSYKPFKFDTTFKGRHKKVNVEPLKDAVKRSPLNENQY